MICNLSWLLGTMIVTDCWANLGWAGSSNLNLLSTLMFGCVLMTKFLMSASATPTSHVSRGSKRSSMST